MLIAAPAIPWIMSGVSALIPLLSEAMRDKPDPEAAKLLIESKRAEMVDKAVGAGLDRKKAEAQVDAEIQKGFAEAERQGQFNFPGGEMIGMAILGGVGGWAAGKAASAIGKMVGKGAGAKASAEAAASKVADVDDVAKAGMSTDIRGMGAASVNQQMAPGRMPAVGAAPTANMGAPGPTGMPFPQVTSRRDLDIEFAGAPPIRPMQQPGMASSEITSPFPSRPSRGAQTLEQEFGISKPYGEMDLRGEFGMDYVPVDRAGGIRRLMQRQGD